MNTLLEKDGLKLGFGLMRLPKCPDGSIDIEQGKKMVDAFIDAGGIYFDTAFVYEGSEEATKAMLVDRYPRESYYLATKLNAGMIVHNEEEAKNEFNISLERTGAGYFDFYLLHALGSGNREKYDNYGLWDFVKELKAQGKIKHYGFSFHDKAEVLDELLTAHPDVEFVQLQINYADWESAKVQSGKCYEVAAKHNKPVIVMEPVKGGALMSPPPSVAEIFKNADADASLASWAIRFVASKPQVMMVLSGMSSLEQMEDNLSFMRDFKPLNEDEEVIMEKARDALAAVDQIACTSCRYCTPGCPQNINIPEIFGCMNLYMVYNDLAAARRDYGWRPGPVKASACIRCGQCESVCPQKLPIMDNLEKCVEILEK